jgi:hypothetical protein
MKTLKVTGLVALVLWMAWITWRIEQIHRITLWTCGLNYADIEGWNLKDGRKPPNPKQRPCGFVDLFQGP